jgi:hypothetical protein
MRLISFEFVGAPMEEREVRIEEKIPTITCPRCKREIKIIKFGRAWVAACCNEVLYNDEKLPYQTSRSEIRSEWPSKS